MPRTEHALFRSIPQEDYLKLFQNGEPIAEKVLNFLGYKEQDVASVTNIPRNSIKYDNRMPSELRDRLIEWATAINLVASYFKDYEKTMLWFQIPNPQLGGISPRDMIRLGLYNKLLKFIQTALDENIR